MRRVRAFEQKRAMRSGRRRRNAAPILDAFFYCTRLYARSYISPVDLYHVTRVQKHHHLSRVFSVINCRAPIWHARVPPTRKKDDDDDDFDDDTKEGRRCRRRRRALFFSPVFVVVVVVASRVYVLRDNDFDGRRRPKKGSRWLLGVSPRTPVERAGPFEGRFHKRRDVAAAHARATAGIQ